MFVFSFKVRNKLKRSLLGVGILKLLSIPVGFAVSIILARTLGPEGFGQYAFIMSLVALVSLPVSGGLPQLLTREIAMFAHSKEWGLYRGALRASHAWVLIVAVAILLGFWGLKLALDIRPLTGKWALLPIAIILVPLTGLAAVRTGSIKGLGFPAYAEVPNQLILPAITLVLFAILAWRDALHIEAAIWSQIVGAGIVFILASCMFFRIQPNEAKGVAANYRLSLWMKALLPFSMIALVSTFNVQIGITTLGFFSTDEQVAAMRVAERGGQVVVMSLALVNMVIAPYIVRAYKDGDRLRLQELARKSARGSFLLALPAAIVLILGGEPLIALAFGAEYAEISYWPVVIVAVGQVFNVFFGSVGYLLSMSGHEKETLKGQLLAVFLNVGLCLALVPTYGAIGAAIGIAAGTIAWNILLWLMVKRRIGIEPTAF